MDCPKGSQEIFWIFRKFPKISQDFVFFLQWREKLTYGLLNPLKNMLK